MANVTQMFRRGFCAAALSVGLAGMLPALSRGAAPPAAVRVTLARGGLASQPVVISTGATEMVTSLAVDLTNLLQRITGADFELIKSTTAAAGIVLAEPGQFADLPADFVFSAAPTRREEYRIRTHPNGVWIGGASSYALSHAVWGLLDGLGYRLYFPTDTWEVVPVIPTLELALEIADKPDFITRNAPRGAAWSDRALWRRWHQRNRVLSAFEVSTGHAYGGIQRANRAAFEAHPEFYALNKGERASSKFCVSNPALRKLVVDHAVGLMRKNPERESLSMDPSDGGGWCECADCARLGTPSDAALMLANEVAVAINDLGLGAKYVGMYAYNQHSPPPAAEVHPNIVVSVATSFLRGGLSFEEIMEGWRARGATLGVRDYYAVFVWDHAMPRRAKGGNLPYLREKIPYFHAQGARYMNACSADSWGANGLGYWIAPRLLWRVADAERLDGLIEDFLANAFGPAAAPMREFYTMLNNDTSLITSEHMVASMYRLLESARQVAAARPEIMARLDDLVLYTRYCELYFDYRLASGEERQAAFEAVWRHTYRMHDRMMLPTVAICHREKYRDRSVEVPAEAEWTVPEDKNPWKSSEPWTAAEISSVLRDGIAANQPVVLDFEPVEFSDDLALATPLVPEGVDFKQGRLPLKGRGLRKFLLWFDAPRALPSEVVGGLIYRDRGNVKIKLFAEQEATLEAVAEDSSVPPDGKPYGISLSSPYSGLHTLEVSDGGDRTSITIPPELPLTVLARQGDPAGLGEPWSLYCYVPPGTRIVGGYSDNTRGRLLDGSGSVVYDFRKMAKAGYFSVPVAEGQDGAFWRFENCGGERFLMTIPPYLADHPSRLLLPREVVEKFAGR